MNKNKKYSTDDGGELEIFTPIIGKTLKDWRIDNDVNLHMFFTDGCEAHFENDEVGCGCDVRCYISDMDDIDVLKGSPLTMAESVTNKLRGCTFTFYRFASANGYVTIRWYGESNGYYSETVRVSYRNETVSGRYGLNTIIDFEPFDYEEVEVFRDGKLVTAYYLPDRRWIIGDEEVEAKDTDLWKRKVDVLPRMNSWDS